MLDKSTTIFVVQVTRVHPYNEEKTQGHRQWRRGGGAAGGHECHICTD